MPGFFTSQAIGSQTPAVQALFSRTTRTGGSKRKRRRATKVSAAPRRKKKRAAASGGKRVKMKAGSAAAKAWGAKMKRLRKKRG